MIKKEYQKPAMQVVLLQHQAHLLSGSGDPVTNVDAGDTGIGIGGGSNGDGRARSFGGWDDEDDY